MKLNNKYIIGTNVMFYEIEILHENIDAYIQCCEGIENPENITFDFLFNLSQYLEGIDTSKISVDELKDRFLEQMKRLEDIGVKVIKRFYEDDSKLYCIADYRRDLNYNNCMDNDYIIWGETDSLFPKQFFEALERIKMYASQQNIHRYITWFASRKMWDDSWKPLEHIAFENEKYISIKDFETEEQYKEAISKSPHSIRYVMGIDEMNEINSKYDDIDILQMSYPKFNGCGLVISSDLIKNGVNIPPGIFGVVAEDTAMMLNCHHMMQGAYRQFVVKNVLLVHNREHPNKRMYALDNKTGKESVSIGEGGYGHGKGNWYDTISEINKTNTHLLGPRQDKFKTIDDFLNESKN